MIQIVKYILVLILTGTALELVGTNFENYNTFLDIFRIVILWSLFIFTIHNYPKSEVTYSKIIGILGLISGAVILKGFLGLRIFQNNVVFSYENWIGEGIFAGIALLLNTIAWYPLTNERQQNVIKCTILIVPVLLGFFASKIFLSFTSYLGLLWVLHFTIFILFLSILNLVIKAKDFADISLRKLTTLAVIVALLSETLYIIIGQQENYWVLIPKILRLFSWYLVYYIGLKAGFFDPVDKIMKHLQEATIRESEGRERAERRARELEALGANFTDILEDPESEKLLDTILTRAITIINGDSGELYLYDRKIDMLTVAANSGDISATYKNASLQDGFLGEINRTRKTMFVHRYSLDINYIPNYLDNSWSAVIGSPLLSASRLIGVLVIHSDDPAHEFTHADSYFLSLFAQQAAVAIRNAQLLQKAKYKAERDSLTGLYNHGRLFDLGKRELTRATRYNHEISVIMCDLDHFKKINDTYGHALGDMVLTTIAKLCKQHARASDIVGRYGGEEFAIILPETSALTAFDVAERLRSEVGRTRISYQKHTIGLTISMGISSKEDGIESFEALLDRADKALYQSKRSGRNKTIIWKEEKATQRSSSMERRTFLFTGKWKSNSSKDS